MDLLRITIPVKSFGQHLKSHSKVAVLEGVAGN